MTSLRETAVRPQHTARHRLCYQNSAKNRHRKPLYTEATLPEISFHNFKNIFAKVLNRNELLPLIWSSMKPGAIRQSPQSNFMSAERFPSKNSFCGSRILPLHTHKSSRIIACFQTRRQFVNCKMASLFGISLAAFSMWAIVQTLDKKTWTETWQWAINQYISQTSLLVKTW